MSSTHDRVTLIRDVLLIPVLAMLIVVLAASLFTGWQVAKAAATVNERLNPPAAAATTPGPTPPCYPTLDGC